MDNGGREALLHHLFNVDLSTVNLRTIPKTAALLDQKISSLPSEEAWWLDKPTNGTLPSSSEEGKGGMCKSVMLFDDYIQHATKTGIKRRVIETQIGLFLKKHMPGLRKRRGVFEFPPLPQCRKTFAEKLQQPIIWNEEQTEWKASWADDSQGYAPDQGDLYERH